jgi:hypothetical protein
MSAVAMPNPAPSGKLTPDRNVRKTEDQAEFDQFLAQHQADYAPATIVEEQLCLQIADCFWRLQRAAQMETDLFDSNDDFLAIFDALDKLRRYRTSIEREWHKSIDQLVKIQATRRKANPDLKKKPKADSKIAEMMKAYLFAPMPGRGPKPEPESKEAEIGFVLQNPESA